MLGVVGADVLQVEALGQLVVELDRGALPLPADRVGDVEVDLRAVERAVAFVERVAARRRASSARFSSRLGVVPRRRPRRETRPAASTSLHLGLQAEVAVDALHEPQQPLDFLADLRLA